MLPAPLLFLLLHLRHQLDTTLADLVEQLSHSSVSRLMVVAYCSGFRDEAGDPEHGAQQYLDIRSLDGAVLYRTELLGAAIEPEKEEGYSQRSAQLKDGTRVRLASRRHAMGDRTVLISSGPDRRTALAQASAKCFLSCCLVSRWRSRSLDWGVSLAVGL